MGILITFKGTLDLVHIQAKTLWYVLRRNPSTVLGVSRDTYQLVDDENNPDEKKLSFLLPTSNVEIVRNSSMDPQLIVVLRIMYYWNNKIYFKRENC